MKPRLLVVILASVIWMECGAQPSPVASQSQVEDFGTQLGATSGAAARPITRTSLELIKVFEGWVAAAYDDPSGYCTIGYGHLIALKKCVGTDLGKYATPLTLSQGESLLEEDTISARIAIQDVVKIDLNTNQFGALTSFVFNVGKKNFYNSTLLRLINDGELQAASGEFKRWQKSKGVVLQGLAQRRACEMAHFNGQLELSSSGRLNRSQCDSLGATSSDGELIDIDAGER